MSILEPPIPEPMITPDPKFPLRRYLLALAIGAGLTAGVNAAPPIFVGDPPPETVGVTCVVEKTGPLVGQQVCSFEFEDGGGFPAFPDTITSAPVELDGGTPDAR